MKLFLTSLTQTSSIAFCSLFVSMPAFAQIFPDNSLGKESSVVTPQTIKGIQSDRIDGGARRGANLFHSFKDFNVGEGRGAYFSNPTGIENILGRVTGGNTSTILGILGVLGDANLFLINPNGILFGANASLDLRGSFVGSTADSILFEGGKEFSATNPTKPLLTINANAPIGLNFRDNPQPITNRSVVTDETGNDLIGLRVQANKTLALIGGDISIEGGFLSTIGGRIELGSVSDNSRVSITPVEKGFDFSYEGVENFQDIDLSLAAFVQNIGANTGDIQVQGRNISLIQGSGIDITTESGQAGNLNIIASESLTLDGNAAEVDLGDFNTLISSGISNDATGKGSKINIEVPQLTITNGAEIAATNNIGDGQGVSIAITASNINLSASAIFSQVLADSIGNAGNIKIDTEKLILNQGAQINASTLGAGDGGNLFINASKSIDLIGTKPDSTDPSALFANVEKEFTATGNGGDININTPRLVVKDGAQIGTTAQNGGNGGNVTINADSILLSGTSPLAEFRGLGRSGITINVEGSLQDKESGTIIPTTGNGGRLNLKAEELIIEKGAFISADTFSLGKGGSANINVNKLIVRDGGEIGSGSLLGINPVDTERGSGGSLTIDASKLIEVIGTGEINGETVKSSIFTLAESTGNAGNVTLKTDNLTVSNGGEINASAIQQGQAGNININANSINLTNGDITASTNAGSGGNISLEIADNLILDNNSLISAEAKNNAQGGNIDIDAEFVVAFDSTGEGNDIIAKAQQGLGGKINLTAEGIFGIEERKASFNNQTNDLDASSEAGPQFNGILTINTPDLNPTQGLEESPENIVEPEEIAAQTCSRKDTAKGDSSLTIVGRGGIPSTGIEPLNNSSIQIENNLQTESSSNLNTNQIVTKVDRDDRLSSDQIVPARGMMMNDRGEVVLTRYPTLNDTQNPVLNSVNCK